MTELNFENLPFAVSEMAKQIDEIKTILSETQSQQDTSKKQYTLPEAADYCSMAEATFRNYVSERKVAGVKFGKPWVFLEVDLDKFIQDHRRPTAKELEAKAFEQLTSTKKG